MAQQPNGHQLKNKTVEDAAKNFGLSPEKAAQGIQFALERFAAIATEMLKRPIPATVEGMMGVDEATMFAIKARMVQEFMGKMGNRQSRRIERVKKNKFI